MATGAAWVALGSDTGGSIRIPAALQGVVGFKSTARLVPTEGAVPLSTTLDTVSAMTRSVRDAVVVHEVLAARKVRLAAPAARGAGAWPCPSTVVLDGLDATVARAFERALATLSARRRADRDDRARRARRRRLDQRHGRLLGRRGWAGTAAGSPSARPTTTRGSHCGSGAARR